MSDQVVAITYQASIASLEKLFGRQVIGRCLPRLNEIYEYTECLWLKYVEQLADTPVRYLLIAEAPPWSASGRPHFVLDLASTPRTLMRALRMAFLGDQRSGASPEIVLQELASRGFLLVDSLPFSMKYSSRQRQSDSYRELVARSVASYLQEKLNFAELDFAPDLRVAFSVRLNAEAILQASSVLCIRGRSIPLSRAMIATGSNNYPDAGRLRELFSLVAD
jgi:hypothetical protein